MSNEIVFKLKKKKKAWHEAANILRILVTEFVNFQLRYQSVSKYLITEANFAYLFYIYTHITYTQQKRLSPCGKKGLTVDCV